MGFIMVFSIHTSFYFIVIPPLSALPIPPVSLAVPPSSSQVASLFAFLSHVSHYPVLPHALLPSCAALPTLMTYTRIFESRFHVCEETCGICLF